MFEGLTTNGLAAYPRVLTGYVPGAEALRVVGQRIERMKEEDPNVIYVLDRM